MRCDEAMRELAAEQHGVVARRQCRALGATTDALRHRLTAGTWTALSPAVLHLAGAPVTDHSRVMAAVLDAGRGAVASHRTAAWLWGLPGFRPGGPEVTRLRGRGRPRPALARVHEPRLLPARHCTTVDGVPVTTVPRMLFDLAGVLHPDRVARAVDNAMTRSPALLPALHRMLSELAAHGRSGVDLMRTLLEDRPLGYVPPASGLEARAIRLLDAAGIPTVRQVDLGGGDWIGRVDLLVAGTRVIVEVDSVLHHTSRLDRARDAARDAKLRSLGFVVVRVTERDLWECPREFIQRVRTVVLAA